MKKYPELHRREFEQFLERFCMRETLKFRNNKWIGLTRGGKPFTMHVKQEVLAMASLPASRLWIG